MISGRQLVDELIQRGIEVVVSVPCSLLRPLLAAAESSGELLHIPATSESEAVGIAAGVWLAGKKPLLMMQNSGFFECLNAIASLLVPMGAPIPFLVTARGGFGIQDEPHHSLVGRSFLTVAHSLDLPFAILENSTSEGAKILDALWQESERLRLPNFLVVTAGAITDDVAERSPLRADVSGSRRDVTRGGKEVQTSQPNHFISRREGVIAIIERVKAGTIVVAGVGFVGRELLSTGDRDTYLYLAGAMGCASAVGLGLSVCVTSPVVILDGDGAALMRLGNLVTIGSMGPKNLSHVMFNNGQYESTGGQHTVGRKVDFSEIASICGYPECRRFWDAKELGEAVSQVGSLSERAPLFAEVMIEAGAVNLPRPSVPLAERAELIRKRFSRGLA